ncbi:MAG TPA: alpha/beta fold hydrolase, partial [Thermoanaerobaculia bacterium]|nr:alpha/beta fold hydrolase [Thermoanaerobaculia bacterium]
VPAWWIRGAHAQTIWGRLTRSRRAVTTWRGVLRTPDDDELIADHLEGSRLRFVLLHGLEGSSNSVYIQGLLSVIARYGFAASSMNFRSCARDPKRLSHMIMNRRPRLYHSGETEDFDFLVRSIPPDLPLVAIGVSLGGNVLLKWLGEHPNQTLIKAAATMSVPYDLAAGSSHLERGAGPLYVARFLRTMRPKSESVVRRFGVDLDLDAVRRSRNFREFDGASTAPLHGFRDANDYYERASSLAYLDKITTPTLCISAEDDPFLPIAVLRAAQAHASSAVEFVVPRFGGHTGFIGGTLPWRAQYWAEELMVRWAAERAGFEARRWLSP